MLLDVGLEMRFPIGSEQVLSGGSVLPLSGESPNLQAWHLDASAGRRNPPRPCPPERALAHQVTYPTSNWSDVQ